MSKTDPLAVVKARRAEDASIGVPAGWVPLMLELHERLVESCPAIEYVQIKQKWGELRVYVRNRNDAAQELIAAAELASRTICEVCGAPGSPCVRRGWYRALCPTHAAEMEYTEVSS
ncbi:hypothetical protein [Mycobacteroides abscessus]|uniref:hypothetical protein n=1 Tax=Mycobacteroides abscessus TaxID=36809 RepID=UPI0019CFA09F|nr:hypothetical protein [Mycobacteroides abscessus]MBN7457360.1 hypothetical protein [Mycobacteroides abscessus subsp. abscessus]